MHEGPVRGCEIANSQNLLLAIGYWSSPVMPRSKLISFEEVGTLIPDEAIVTVSSSSGLGCPHATLRAIGEHFAKFASPKNLPTLHPIDAGDMYGMPVMDH